MDQLLNSKLWLWLSVPTLVVGLLTYYWIKWSRVFIYWKSRNIRTPTAVPFMGTNLSMVLRRRPENDLKWQEAFGKIYGLYMWEKPVLTVAEPQLIKQILVKDFYLFRNRRDALSRHKIFSKIIFFAVNDDWKRMRAITSPTFTSGKLKKMYSLINKCCTDFLEDLNEKVGNETQIELKQVMGNYTMDVIARCAFAYNTNTYKDPKNEFMIRGTNLFNISVFKMIFLMSLPRYLFRFPSILKLLNSTENQDFFVKFASNVIKYRKESNEKHNDFLQLLMDVETTDDPTGDEGDANEVHHINEGKEELIADKEAFSGVVQNKLTENEILAQCFIFLIAGFETTAATLSYCTYELALHPELQDRLYEETHHAFDEYGQINYEVLAKLPFIDALISETLRSYPPILRLERTAMTDVLLGDSGVKVEKGVLVEIPVYAIHHDPENFPDPFTFNPDRFMPVNRDKIKPYTYIPFGVGPRNCMGMRFALLEVKLALARISQKFKFLRVAETDVPVIFNRGRGVLQAKRLIVGIEKR